MSDGSFLNETFVTCKNLRYLKSAIANLDDILHQTVSSDSKRSLRSFTINWTLVPGKLPLLCL